MTIRIGGKVGGAIYGLDAFKEAMIKQEGWISTFEIEEVHSMDCETCANYEPKKVGRPPNHRPGRIYTADLRVGMVIRRHQVAPSRRKLVVLLGEAGQTWIPALQLRAGQEPIEMDMWLPAAGLQPYSSGNWSDSAWCEEVT